MDTASSGTLRESENGSRACVFPLNLLLPAIKNKTQGEGKENRGDGRETRDVSGRRVSGSGRAFSARFKLLGFLLNAARADGRLIGSAVFSYL